MLQVVTAKGYGVKNLVTRENVTDRTLFVIASITKQFVATVVGHVLKKHKLVYESITLQMLQSYSVTDVEQCYSVTDIIMLQMLQCYICNNVTE